ncbi:DUF4421 family protein [Chryseobacterium sp. SIMBA_038]|uniref:DUF4421 family protein n=1 Tax=Chryseobacterium sp. SIMBA_038 TaxID=3085780 RepID=UPI0039798F9A
MKKTTHFLLCCLLGFLANAQKQPDSTKIISYEDQVMIRLNFDTNIEDYVAVYKGEEFPKTKLSINNKINTSFSIDYKIISATFSFAPNFIPGNNDNHLKGESSYSDIRFRFFPKSFIQTVYYKNLKGFYLKNMQDFDPDWQKGKNPYLQLPNLRIQSFGGITAYSFNKDFSLKSIYYQREWQKESNGSFVPALEYDLTFFKDKDIDNLKSVETQFNLGANLAYYYNWVVTKNVNISPFAFAGVGGKWSSYQEDLENGSKSDKEKNKYFTKKFGGGIHIGYNSDRFLFGGKLNLMSYNYKQDSDSRIQNNNTYGLIYVGYRFAPPKVVKNSYDKIQKKVPIL